MGFTTGFLGGLTLTYSILYLSVYAHRQNRTHQSLLLRQQSQLLRNLIEPAEPEAAPPAYRVDRGGLEELLKDRWNREVEGLVRRAQHTDWEAVRVRVEGSLARAWARVRGAEGVQELEQRVREGAADLRENVVDGAERVKESVVAQSERAKDGLVGSGSEVKEGVKEKTVQAVHGKRLLEL